MTRRGAWVLTLVFALAVWGVAWVVIQVNRALGIA